MHREHQDGALGGGPLELLGRLDAAHARHGDVHEHDLRPRAENRLDALRGAALAGDDAHVRRVVPLVAEVVGKSRAHVANTLRLLSLPRAVQDLLDNGQISVGQARPLIGLNDAEAAAKLIVKRGMSARQAERLAKNFGRKRGLALVAKDTDTAALEQSLAQATGYKVSIAFDGKGGSVTVAYTSLEQLDDIVRRLSSGGRAKDREEIELPVQDIQQAS